MRRAGLVATRRQGKWIFYSLRATKGRFHRDLLACLGSCFDDVPELAKDAQRARRLRDAGGCCPD